MGFGRSLSDIDACLTIFTKEQRLGLVSVVASSALSLTAVAVLFLLYLRNVRRTFLLHSRRRIFLNTDVDVYFLSVLLSDSIVAVGGIMNLKWILIGHCICGKFCTIQGVLQQAGAPAVALSTLAIAIHTFLVIFLKWTPPANRYLSFLVVILIWVSIFFLVFLSWFFHHANNQPFFTPTPYWCWINQHFLLERLVADYVYPWAVALLSTVIYALLFLRLRGIIVLDPERLSRISFTSRLSHYSQRDVSTSQESSRFRALTLVQQEAYTMLWYPLCYTILISPISIVRWMAFRNDNGVSFVAITVCASIFKLSGVLNVTLFMLTRPNLLLFGERPRSTSTPPQPTINIDIPTSATPILASPLSESLQMDSTTPVSPVVARPEFQPLTLDLPSPRISVFQTWETLQREGQILERRPSPLRSLISGKSGTAEPIATHPSFVQDLSVRNGNDDNITAVSPMEPSQRNDLEEPPFTAKSAPDSVTPGISIVSVVPSSATPSTFFRTPHWPRKTRSVPERRAHGLRPTGSLYDTYSPLDYVPNMTITTTSTLLDLLTSTTSNDPRTPSEHMQFADITATSDGITNMRSEPTEIVSQGRSDRPRTRSTLKKSQRKNKRVVTSFLDLK